MNDRRQVMRHVLPALLLVSSMAVAADGPQVLKQQCAECHALQAPAKQRRRADCGRARARTSTTPADKFQRAWLVAWLEAPTRVRPAGEFYRHHLKDGAEGDVIDEATLAEHPKLDKAKAPRPSPTPCSRCARPGLVESGAYKGAAVSATMGAMFFGKLRGCAACHQDAPGKGGVSGTRALHREHPAQRRLRLQLHQAAAGLRPPRVDARCRPRRERSAAPDRLPHATQERSQAMNRYIAPLCRRAQSRAAGRHAPAAHIHAPSAITTPTACSATACIATAKASMPRTCRCSRGITPTARRWATCRTRRCSRPSRRGGLAVNKSILMPVWGKVLGDDEIHQLVDYLREICKCGK
jgi:hypothetical protein